MGRSSFGDPYRKKAKGGYKILKGIYGTAFNVGAVTLHEATRAAPATTPQNTLPSSSLLVFFIVFVGVLFGGHAAFGWSLFGSFVAAVVISFIATLVHALLSSASPQPTPPKPQGIEAVPLEHRETVQFIKTALPSDTPMQAIADRLADFAPDVRKDLLAWGYELAVEALLDTQVLSLAQEERIAAFMQQFELSQDDLNSNGWYEKTVKSSLLRSILEGFIPEGKLNIQGELPFNLQKGETIVWLFQGVNYLEQKDIRSYSGSSAGLSVRIADGLYHRTGAFRGQPVITTEMKYLSTGLLAATNKHLYFASPQKSFRIPYDKVVAYHRYEDGLGLQKEGATASPQVFAHLDGWFAYNLVVNINKAGAPFPSASKEKPQTTTVQVPVEEMKKFLKGGIMDNKTYNLYEDALLEGRPCVPLPSHKFEALETKWRAAQQEAQLLERCAQRNTEGVLLEKEGRWEEAIPLYEANIAEGYPATHAFDRLGVLYRRKKDAESEKRVLHRYAEVLRWSKKELEERLAKIDSKAQRRKS